MRKPAGLAALFPTLRGDVLAATLTQPDKWWYLSELAQFLGTTPSSLQRELKALVDGGILQQRREGTRTYFKAETRSPLFPELRGLLEKTAGLLPTLQQALKSFDTRIDCAFVYGSLARSQEHALSDVDLMVIGRVGLAELAPALRKAENRLGREVNVTSYSAREFRKRIAAKDHFLSEVLRGPKEFVKGDQRDLDDIIGTPRRSTPSDLEKRTLGVGANRYADYLEACRRKRNVIDYTRSHVASETEANEIVEKATDFYEFVEAWIDAHLDLAKATRPGRDVRRGTR